MKNINLTNFSLILIYFVVELRIPSFRVTMTTKPVSEQKLHLH